MEKVLGFFGFPTEGKGRTWGIVAIALMAANLADIFNFADPIGLTKKALNKFVPSIFGADKFRGTKSVIGNAPTRAVASILEAK